MGLNFIMLFNSSVTWDGHLTSLSLSFLFTERRIIFCTLRVSVSIRKGIYQYVMLSGTQ